jgi:hypothetical protein
MRLSPGYGEAPKLLNVEGEDSHNPPGFDSRAEAHRMPCRGTSKRDNGHMGENRGGA